MTVQSNFPSIKPSLLLDFANVKALDPRITFTRTTTATYYDANGVLQTAASGVARFDHNPTTGESLGLLVEEQRTNLLTYSDDFATWSKVSSSINSNTIVAPDGTLTGDKLVENTSNAWHYVNPASISITAQSYTISVYAKAGERSVLQIVPNGGVFPTSYINFDLSAGTVSASSAVDSSSITPVGNGWYRCVVSDTATSASSVAPFYITIQNSPTAARAASYTGDGSSGLYLWGAQLEAGAFPTSYIATTSASVTRNADVASMTGTNFSSWYRADEGTFFVDWTAGQDDIFINPLAGGGAVNTGIFAFRRGSSGNLTYAVTNGTTVQANITLITGSPVSGTQYKAVGSYKVDDFAASVNGAAAGTDTSGTVPANIANLVIGSGWNNTTGAIANEYLNSTIKKIAFYPSRLSDAQLQALTAS